MTSKAAAGALLAVLLGGAACSHAPEQPADRPTPLPSSATRLDAAGVVPWVDERIERVGEPVPAATVRADSAPCRADGLRGRLAKWWKPVPGAGGGGPIGAVRDDDAVGGKLIGEVDIRNASTVDCTLRGEADARLFSGGAEVPIHYDHGISQEARARVVPVPAGRSVTLRLDWTGPYCGTAKPPYTLRITLPDGGGVLTAPVVPKDHPACSRSETHPQITSFLSADGFSAPAPDDPDAAVRSPLQALTVGFSGPDRVAAGTRLRYLVTLTNPTARAVSLLPCPGYLQELFSLGSATDDAVNSSTLYRLNCRAQDHVDPGAALRFEMIAQVPAGMRAGREFDVTWRLVSAQDLGGKPLFGVLKTTIG
jgi:hypothetical protein